MNRRIPNPNGGAVTAALIVWFIALLVCIGFWVGVVWVAWHFIAKFW